MTDVCPVNERKINAYVARLNALLTFGILAVYLFFPNEWLLAFLIADFLLRIMMQGKFSPLSNLNRLMLSSLQVKPNFINAAPKEFAAKIGFGLSLLVLGLYLTGFVQSAMLVAGIIVFFAFLESAFGICVACKLYPYYLRLFGR